METKCNGDDVPTEVSTEAVHFSTVHKLKGAECDFAFVIEEEIEMRRRRASAPVPHEAGLGCRPRGRRSGMQRGLRRLDPRQGDDHACSALSRPSTATWNGGGGLHGRVPAERP